MALSLIPVAGPPFVRRDMASQSPRSGGTSLTDCSEFKFDSSVVTLPFGVTPADTQAVTHNHWRPVADTVDLENSIQFHTIVHPPGRICGRALCRLNYPTGLYVNPT